MTRKHLNPLAAELGIDLARINRKEDDRERWAAQDGFWAAVQTLITGLQRANPAVSRDRFIEAIMDSCSGVEQARKELAALKA